MATGVLNSSNTEIKCLRNNDLDEIINLTNKEEQIKRFYYSDNLDALNNLSLDDNVVGKVELIYIDPPYNTGFTYQTRDLVNAYNDKFSIEDYVAFMKKRLILLYKLLSPSGSIYVQLDSNMLFHIKILMDEIFGTNHFKGLITRKKCKNKNNTTKNYGNISDYILFYTKSNSSTWHRPYAPWPEDKITKEYPFIEKIRGDDIREFLSMRQAFVKAVRAENGMVCCHLKESIGNISPKRLKKWMLGGKYIGLLMATLEEKSILTKAREFLCKIFG
jgi:adenine specific DNA methylase Mod